MKNQTIHRLATAAMALGLFIAASPVDAVQPLVPAVGGGFWNPNVAGEFGKHLFIPPAVVPPAVVPPTAAVPSVSPTPWLGISAMAGVGIFFYLAICQLEEERDPEKHKVLRCPDTPDWKQCSPFSQAPC